MKRSRGFTTVEFIFVLAILIVLAVAIGFLYNRNSNQNNSATNSKTNSSWKAYCDKVSKTCLYYPSTWKAKTGLGNAGITIVNPPETVVTYENPNSGDCNSSGSSVQAQMHINSVNPINSKSLDLKAVGGYVIGQLNGAPVYDPRYFLTSSKFVNQHGLKAGKTVSLPDAWTCYNLGVIKSEASAQPIGKNTYNAATKQATSWFNTNEAKTGLKILQSIYTTSQ